MTVTGAAFKLISFDAAGTLIHLRKSVGFHYALVAERIGLTFDANALDAAFIRSWKEMPARLTTGQPREDDDKGWWRELVDHVIDQVKPETKEVDRAVFFEAAYEHFAEAGVWELFPEVLDVLQQLHPRFPLCIISNFDGRLRMIMEQLGISKFFSAVLVSSEVGADKPDPLIFHRAAEMFAAAPHETLHVGDDPVRDWKGARSAGFSVFELDRPGNSLHDLLTACAPS